MTTDPAALSSDFDEIRDVTVIGAGPVGMCTAFWAGMREASSRIIDSLPELGGPLTTLYPEKWVFDVPGHPKVLAKDLVELMRQQALEQFDVPVHLNTTAETISWEGDGDGSVERVRRVHSEDEAHEAEVEVDATLPQLGFKTALGPLKDWGFETEKGAIVVDQVMKTSLERVWACGDITTSNGKLKLIATGFSESAVAVAQAVHEIRPGMKIQPKYSTNTGVPGAVAGQP